MNAFLDRPSASAVRWVARILGSLVGFVALFGVMESLTYHLDNPAEVSTSGVLTWVGFALILVGCVVGWFKDLSSSLFILGGVLLILVTALAFPGSLRMVYMFAIAALPGFLYLYVHLAGKKEMRGRDARMNHNKEGVS
jgi:hypothetical protein